MEKYLLTEKQLIRIFAIFTICVFLFGIAGYIAGTQNGKCKITIQELPPEKVSDPVYSGPIQPSCDESFFRAHGYCQEENND